jgi:hypothetical protein
MDYNELTLKEEIRRCLTAHNKPIHPENIRRWIEQDRIKRESYKDIQKLKTITNKMYEMEDIEVIRVDGINYRQFKKQHKLTRAYHWIMSYQLTVFIAVKNYLQTIKDYLIKLKI